MLTLYGIKSCNTCRKARQAAEKAGKEVTFVDIRETPLTPSRLQDFSGVFGDALLNRKSTTWRGLPEAEKKKDVVALILQYPTLMKRPVIAGKTLTLGWSSEISATHLG
ncbi:MAG: ArsC/Spx/MgsR family protein [Pseudomonadota bacterium]